MLGGILGLLVEFIVAIVAGIIASVLVVLYFKRQAVRAIEKNLPSWRLLYEHDAEGSPTDGKLADLQDAIRKAYDIKVMVKKEQWPHLIKAEWLFVDTDSGTVHALNTSQISVTPQKDKSGNLDFVDNPYHYYVLVNTKGVYRAKRVGIGGSPGKEAPAEKICMAWFGQIPPQPT